MPAGQQTPLPHPQGESAAPHHPLPTSDKARDDELPETAKREKGYDPEGDRPG